MSCYLYTIMDKAYVASNLLIINEKVNSIANLFKFIINKDCIIDNLKTV